MKLAEDHTQLTCRNCGTTGACALMQKGPHVEARCTECGEHVKFVRQEHTDWREYVMPFGKYKDQPFGEIENIAPSYFKWLLTTNIKGSLRENVQAAWDHLGPIIEKSRQDRLTGKLHRQGWI